MNRLGLFAVQVAALATIWTLPALGQESFRMICRGSSQGIVVKIHAGDASNSYQKLGLFFQKAPRAAGQNGRTLLPGTCAWVDRPINAAEPDIIAHNIPPGLHYQVDFDRPGGNVIHFRPHNGAYGWVDDLHNPNKLWTFYVYNTRQGELRVTQSIAGTGVLID